MFSSLCLCLFIHSHFLLRVPCLLRLVLLDLPPRVPNRWKLAQCNGRVPELLGTQWGLGPGRAPSGRVTSGFENEGRGQAGPTGPLEHSALQPRGPISPPAVPTMAVGSGRSLRPQPHITQCSWWKRASSPGARGKCPRDPRTGSGGQQNDLFVWKAAPGSVSVRPPWKSRARNSTELLCRREAQSSPAPGLCSGLQVTAAQRCLGSHPEPKCAVHLAVSHGH